MKSVYGDENNDGDDDDDRDSDSSLVMTTFSYNNHLLTLTSGALQCNPSST